MIVNPNEIIPVWLSIISDGALLLYDFEPILVQQPNEFAKFHESVQFSISCFQNITTAKYVNCFFDTLDRIRGEKAVLQVRGNGFRLEFEFGD
jgi:hypothetical protein